jgi:AbrB family looped-hinge helix DNA binding protein
MATTLTSKGQVTVPKKIRDSLRLVPGTHIEFAVNGAGEVVLRKTGKTPMKRDRFEVLRGSTQIKWRTNDLMVLLRE